LSEYRVLIPLDGSRVAERSFEFLPALKHMGDLGVLLLSAVEAPEDSGTLSKNEAADREANVLTTYLHELAGDIDAHLDVKVETKVRRGPVAACILDQAAAFNPDLIVIATHGRSGLLRWRLGSVADKVIRAAEHNTLVVGPKAADQARWLEAELVPAFEDVLVPLDGSELAEEALPVAAAFARRFQSNLHLVRVVPISLIAEDTSFSYTAGGTIVESLMAASAGYLDKLADRLGAEGGLKNVKTDALLGTAAAQLEEYATANSIDLIVMTSHGRGGILRTALGSVTDRLLGGPAPVLVVRPRKS